MTNRKYDRFTYHPVGNWVVSLDRDGATIIKKGSWRANPRLWKPRYYVSTGRPYPKGVPEYVKREIREMRKRLR